MLVLLLLLLLRLLLLLLLARLDKLRVDAIEGHQLLMSAALRNHTRH